MIIDCHGHVSAPAQLWAYKAALLSHRGSHGRGKVKVSATTTSARRSTPPRSAPRGIWRRCTATAPTSSSYRRARSSSCTASGRASWCDGSPRNATMSFIARPSCSPTASAAWPACRRSRARRSKRRCPSSSAASSSSASSAACSIPTRSRTASRRRRRSATGTGIRSTRSSASSTCRRTSTPPARAPSASAIRCISSTRRPSRSWGS